MPINPHIKTRSRLQYEIAKACIATDRPERAVGLLPKIDNWRQGLLYSDLAFNAAQRGNLKIAKIRMTRARQAAEASTKGASTQEWRTNQILAGIARTETLLEQRSKIDRVAIKNADWNNIHSVHSWLLNPDKLADELKLIDGAIAKGEFAAVRAALDRCTFLFERFFSQAELRDNLLQRVRKGFKKLPAEIRIDLLLRLSRFATQREDKKLATRLLGDAERELEAANFRPEHAIPNTSRIALAWHHAGHPKKAQARLKSAHAAYQLNRGKIVDIYRAGILRPIAEANLTIGNRDQARKLYRQVLEDGVGNPNSCPRAEDLVATCLSMQRLGLKPNKKLDTRLRQIAAGLKAPW